MTTDAPLSTDAPEGEVVEPVSSPPTPEVTDGSGTPAAPAAPAAPAQPAVPSGFIEKARFDGLMSEFNKVQGRLKEMERQSLPAEDRERADKEELQTQVTNLSAALAEMQLEAAKDAAIAANPKLAPFKDLLYAETPEDVFELAKDLTARLDGSASTAPAAPATEEQTPPAPVSPGSTTFQGPSTDDLAAAREKAAATGNWTEYLNAKFLHQQMAQQ